jgi:hypothetical protein
LGGNDIQADPVDEGVAEHVEKHEARRDFQRERQRIQDQDDPQRAARSDALRSEYSASATIVHRFLANHVIWNHL